MLCPINGEMIEHNLLKKQTQAWSTSTILVSITPGPKLLTANQTNETLV